MVMRRTTKRASVRALFAALRPRVGWVRRRGGIAPEGGWSDILRPFLRGRSASESPAGCTSGPTPQNSVGSADTSSDHDDEEDEPAGAALQEVVEQGLIAGGAIRDTPSGPHSFTEINAAGEECDWIHDDPTPDAPGFPQDYNSVPQRTWASVYTYRGKVNFCDVQSRGHLAPTIQADPDDVVSLENWW